MAVRRCGDPGTDGDPRGRIVGWYQRRQATNAHPRRRRMTLLTRTVRGLIGLFIDDGKLALTVIAVLISVGLLTQLGSLDGLVAMILLVAGTIIALLAIVIRTAAKAVR